MNFVIAERYGLMYLIIENVYPMECFTLTVQPYRWMFDEWRPAFASLSGMKVKTISDKEGLEILQRYADDSVVGCRIKDFIERYKALPF